MKAQMYRNNDFYVLLRKKQNMMEQDSSMVKRHSLKAWVLAMRPQTLVSAAVPVSIGAALAYAHSGADMRWIPMLLCMLFAFVMQIDANFVNDYFDYKRGNDTSETRLGPKRACSEGWIAPKWMLVAIVLTTVAACVVGLPMVWYGGWWLIGVGALCVLFCFLYTLSLSYMALGDVLVLVFFGLVPVCCTYYLCMPAGGTFVIGEVLAAAVACGMVIDTLLVVNNYRDIDNDRASGKNTLVVLLGKKRSLLLYYALGMAACMVGLLFWYYGHDMAYALTVIYVILHGATYQEMRRIEEGRELNKVLKLTARNILVYGLCVVGGILIS